MMPVGTILGVFTIVVLLRPSVQKLFNNSAPVNDLRPLEEMPHTD